MMEQNVDINSISLNHGSSHLAVDSLMSAQLYQPPVAIPTATGHAAATQNGSATEYVDDELPLPSFAEIFGETSSVVETNPNYGHSHEGSSSVNRLSNGNHEDSGSSISGIIAFGAFHDVARGRNTSNLHHQNQLSGGGKVGQHLRRSSSATTQRRDAVDESVGRWTAEEHRLFLEGIMLYGKDWKKMQPLIKTRSLVQIRTHAQKVFKKVGLANVQAVAKKMHRDEIAAAGVMASSNEGVDYIVGNNVD